MIEITEKLGAIPLNMTICEIEGIKQETSKAVLVDFGDCEHWIPKSVCHYGLDNTLGIPVIAIEDWKYEELGI